MFKFNKRKNNTKNTVSNVYISTKIQVKLNYTPENKHGTSKMLLGKGKTSTNHEFLGSMLVLPGCKQKNTPTHRGATSKAHAWRGSWGGGSGSCSGFGTILTRLTCRAPTCVLRTLPKVIGWMDVVVSPTYQWGVPYNLYSLTIYCLLGISKQKSHQVFI